MHHFSYVGGVLHAEDVSLARIAEAVGTPFYCYSTATLERHYRVLQQAFAGLDALICYAIKANSNQAVIATLARLGAGMDVVSEGELRRARAADVPSEKIIFAGVGKTREEMAYALGEGILSFNVESEPELEALSSVAASLGRTARIALRVNPDVDPRTHPYIATGLRQNKFGIPIEDAAALYRRAREMRHITVSGIGFHIGSQLTELAPFVAALDRVLELADRLQSEGLALAHVDIGGGLGIRYRDESPPAPADYARALTSRLGRRALKILLEPGRALVGQAGLLLTRVEYLKHGRERNFAVVDAAMNDLLRPALYDAWHDVLPVKAGSGGPSYEIVGPVCETGDFLAHDRALDLREGDLLAVLSAGAYGMSMSSNYNTRPRAAEVMADGAAMHLIREREAVSELMAREMLLP